MRKTKRSRTPNALSVMACMQWRLLLIIFAFLTCGGIQVKTIKAADFTVVSTKEVEPPISFECNIHLSGEIIKGDVRKLQAAIKRLDGRWGLTLFLNSKGGSYEEGLLIARHLLENSVRTIIQDGAECYSACAVTFLGGSKIIEDSVYVDRWLHIGGKLGFHAPYIRGVPDRTYKDKVIETAYWAGISAVRRMINIAKGTHFTYVSPDVMPQALIGEMLERGPSEVFSVETIRQLIKFKIKAFGFHIPARVTETMLCNACANLHGPKDVSNWSGCSSKPKSEKRRQHEIWLANMGPGFDYTGNYCVLRFGTWDWSSRKFKVDGNSVWYIYEKGVGFKREERINYEDFIPITEWQLYSPDTKLEQLR